MNLKENRINTIDQINIRLQQQATESDYNRIKLFLGALTIGFLVMGYLFFILEGVVSFFSNTFTPFLVVGWILTFIIYESISLLLVRFFLKRKRIVPRILQITNVVIEAGFPGVLIFMLCIVEWSPIFLDSPLIFIYFIIIVLSALRLEAFLSLIAGLVSSLGYFIVTIWAINTFDPQGDVLNFPLLLYGVRSIFILLTGLCSAYVAREIKNRMENSLKFFHERNQLEHLFGQQVSKQIVDALVSDSDYSRKIEVSIMFLDIRNFSAFAEKRDPEEVIAFQNNIFSPLIEIINNHNGIINQILGDGFMATFGAPVQDPKHAEKAMKAGLEIINKVKDLADKDIIPETKVGIGLHTGEVIAGNIGSDNRKQYSISGSPVIIAARLEQLNKKYKSQFLISRELKEKLGPDSKIKRMGKIVVKNMEKPIEVFWVA